MGFRKSFMETCLLAHFCKVMTLIKFKLTLCKRLAHHGFLTKIRA